MGSTNHDDEEERREPTDGTLAWAPYPNISSMQPWPCLTYRSWSIAILQSGLFPSYHHEVCQEDDTIKRNQGTNGALDDINSDYRDPNISGSGVDSTLAILTCKKRVKLSDLANNRVPLRVALNPGRNDGDSISTNNSISSNSSCRKLGSKQRRSKVVVHFLGVNEWYVASVGDLTPYTAETAITFLKEFHNNKHSGCNEDDDLKGPSSPPKRMINEGVTGTTSTEKNKKRTNEDMNDWQDNWLLAMKEASIACEREESLNPSTLVLHVKDKNDSSKDMTKASSSKLMTKPLVQKERQKVSIKLQKHVKEEKIRVREPTQNDCTPECFDDWRVGGNTQKLSDTSQSQFLLTSEGKT